MAFTPNNTADVSNVKGVQGGYGFSAAPGTALVTDNNPFAAIPDSAANMGFISNDGVSEEIERDTDEVTDINGDVIFVIKTKEKETQKFTLVSTSIEALSQMHGHDNVTDTASYTKIAHNANERPHRQYVFDLLLKDGRKWRKFIPDGQVTDVGGIVYGAGNVFGREITVTCYPDASGNRVYDYIEKQTNATTTTGGETDGETTTTTGGEG